MKGRVHCNGTQHIKNQACSKSSLCKRSGHKSNVLLYTGFTLYWMPTCYLRVPDWQSEVSSAVTVLHSKCSIKVLCIWLACPLSSLSDKAYNVPETLPLYKVWSNLLFWDGAHSLQGKSKCLQGWWDQVKAAGTFFRLERTGHPFPAPGDVL